MNEPCILQRMKYPITFTNQNSPSSPCVWSGWLVSAEWSAVSAHTRHGFSSAQPHPALLVPGSGGGGDNL